MRYLFFFLILVFIATSCKSQDTAVRKNVLPDTTSIKIAFVGDVMGHMPIVNSARIDSSASYDFKPIFEYVSDILSKADISVANLEVPLAGKPYSGYPQFSSPDELGTVLKNIGIDVVIMANNHALDRGKKGLLNTVKVIDSLGLQHTGVFKDTAERRKKYPLIINIKNLRLAFLNYTYSTNGFKAEKPVIVNYLDTNIIKRDLERSKQLKAEVILANFHWGIEYDRFSNKEQHQIADVTVRNGAQAVIGSHPHVIQPFYWIYPNPKDSSKYYPALFSLGNFVSNQRDRYRDGGLIFELNILKIGSEIRLSAGYIPVWVYKGLYNGRMIYRLIPPSRLNDAIQKYKINTSDSAKCMEFFNDTRQHLSNIKEIQH